MADADLSISIEEKKKLSESLTRFSVGTRYFHLKELSIGSTRKFAILVTDAFDRIKASVETGEDKREISEYDVRELLTVYGDAIFKEITTLWNWIFAFGAEYGENGKYKKVTAAWIEENVSIRLLVEIIKEVAVQSRMEWLGPFLKSNFLPFIRKFVTAETAKIG